MKQRLYLFTAAFLIVTLALGAAQFGAWWGSLFFKNAFAQAPTAIQAVDIRTHALLYDWTSGPDAPSELRIKCRPEGTQPGQYTFTRTVPVAPNGAIDLVELLPKNNMFYYCTIVGAVGIPGPGGQTFYAEGVASSELPFGAVGTQFGTGKVSIGKSNK